MSAAAIRADGLGKRYEPGALDLASSVAEAVMNAARWPLRRLGDGGRRWSPVWALRDVSFELAPGEVVGLIGRNGAGKTTLLKILARVTAPTTGRATIHGRVGSLLDIGTGFHPELSGRENIFLSGAVLGMGRREISAKFEEIVHFAEVEPFLALPLKRWSPGMGVRLAFAVAASLDAEIMFVDEVLAVGDVSFQQKCLSKLEEISASGRTVVFVSHSVAAALRLCPRLLLFDAGHLIADGPAPEVMRAYLSAHAERSAERVWSGAHQAGPGGVRRLRSVRVLDSRGAVAEVVARHEPTYVEVQHEGRDGHDPPPLLVRFFNEDGVCLFSGQPDGQDPRGRAGIHRIRCRVPGELFEEGLVRVNVELGPEPGRLAPPETEAVAFQVVERLPDDTRGPEDRPPAGGVVRPRLEWHTDGPGEKD